MEKCFKIGLKKTNSAGCTYEKTWESISQKVRNEPKEYPNLFSSLPNEDPYFIEVPLSQDFLTEMNMILHEAIEYSNYLPISPGQINVADPYDCFHGLLFYIYYYSENKLNTEELEFHYSGGQRRETLASIISKPGNSIDQFNILNIFDYENIRSQFKMNAVKEAFFGVTFKRIKVKPIAYSIRSGPFQNNITHLVSFTFEGYDEKRQAWDILDERVNLNNLIPSGGFAMFYVHSTKKKYSSFKVRQIDPGNNGFWGFSIAAFEIHGEASLIENGQFFESRSSSVDIEDDDKYDPIMDMTDYI